MGLGLSPWDHRGRLTTPKQLWRRVELMQSHGDGTGTVTHEDHFVAISTKVVNLATDPLERFELILETNVQVEVDGCREGNMGRDRGRTRYGWAR